MKLHYQRVTPKWLVLDVLDVLDIHLESETN